MRRINGSFMHWSIFSGNACFRALVVGAVLLTAAEFCAAVAVPFKLDALGVADFDRAVEAAKTNDALLVVYYVPASVEIDMLRLPDGTLTVERDDLGTVLAHETVDLPVVTDAKALLAQIKSE